MFFDKILDAMRLDNDYPTNNNNVEEAEEIITNIEHQFDVDVETEPEPMAELSIGQIDVFGEVPTDIISPEDSFEDIIDEQPKTDEVESNEDEIEQSTETDTNSEYTSQRFCIRGINRRFIRVMREVVRTGKVIPISLMREYNMDQSCLNEILSQARTAQLLDDNNTVLVTSEYYEKFVDHYEPTLYKCEHCDFDKELLICIGEITIENGADSLYEEFNADVLLDYLNILEHMHIIKYDSIENQYIPLISIEEFREECLYIPDSHNNAFSKTTVSTLDKMDGHTFEYFCADLLRDNGFSDVEVTQGSGDHGIDILARKDDITYAIQCKCYSSNVGNAAVQQASTGRQLYHKDIAVVLTNQYFTQQAKDEANAIGVKLWDRNKLRQLIEHSNAKKCQWYISLHKYIQ